MSNEMAERVIRAISETQRIPIEKITIDSTFEELKIDSLDGINVLFALENEFSINIPDDAIRSVRTVRDMVLGIEKLVAGDTGAVIA